MMMILILGAGGVIVMEEATTHCNVVLGIHRNNSVVWLNDITIVGGGGHVGSIVWCYDTLFLHL